MNNYNCIPLFFIVTYNGVIFVIDFFLLLISLILLLDNKENFGDIIAAVLLIYGIIILPFLCCGCGLIRTLLNINENNILQSKIFAAFNLFSMIFTFIFFFMNNNLNLSNFFYLFLFMVNILSMVSIMYLCYNNMGYVEEDINDIEMVQQPQHNQFIYPPPIYPAIQQPNYPFNPTIQQQPNYPAIQPPNYPVLINTNPSAPIR